LNCDVLERKRNCDASMPLARKMKTLLSLRSVESEG
ncbi:hypothetical protein NPIL_646251, partial [Nephila pilipes]